MSRVHARSVGIDVRSNKKGQKQRVRVGGDTLEGKTHRKLRDKGKAEKKGRNSEKPLNTARDIAKAGTNR